MFGAFLSYRVTLVVVVPHDSTESENDVVELRSSPTSLGSVKSFVVKVFPVYNKSEIPWIPQVTARSL